VRQTKAEPDLSAEIALSQHRSGGRAGRVGQLGMTADIYPTGHVAMVSAECEQARSNR
jgi:hypothetical protein